jgi:hypothetical protein
MINYLQPLGPRAQHLVLPSGRRTLDRSRVHDTRPADEGSKAMAADVLCVKT